MYLICIFISVGMCISCVYSRENSLTMSAYDPPSPPFYYSPHQRLLVRLPDHLLTLAVPVIAYWSLSLVFHVFDLSGWKWLDKYKLHESEELRKRNLVQRSEVVFAVIFQQIIQTLMGFLWLQEEVDTTNAARAALVIKGLQRWQSILEVLAHQFHFHFETAKAAWFMYWWAVPLFQFLFAMYVSLSLSLSLSLFSPVSMTFSQVHYRHMAIFPSPCHACESIPV